MAYNQKQLDAYRQLIERGESFKSTTCPYCNGQRDATIKHLHPSTKPADAWSFWRDVLIRKYAKVQSAAAHRNMELKVASKNATAAEKDGSVHDDDTVEPRMFVVGPMVDQSELPFRMLCRQYGATLAYTPMLHAKSFAEGAAYRKHFLTTTPPEVVKAAMEGGVTRGADHVADDESAASLPADEATATTPTITSTMKAEADVRLVDRPCIVQFCGHDADTVLAAARYAVLGEGAGAAENDNTSSKHSAESESKKGDPVYPVHVQLPKQYSPAAASADETHDGLSSAEADSTEAHLLYNCDAVDLNLGCPQGIARRGHYGSFLMEDWELVHTIIHTLHVELEVPVTVKIRVFDHPGRSDADAADTALKHDFDEALTILYARMIRDAGAQVLCVHGRTRDMKGQLTSVANMELIRRVRAALQHTIPVISNGNVFTYDDVVQHLRDTQCEGHMCAEPLLWDPALFSHPPHPVMPGRTHGADKATRLSALHTALVYMDWVRRCPVDIGFVKAHLFKMCFHSYELHTTFREAVAQLKTSASTMRDYEEGDEGGLLQQLVQPSSPPPPCASPSNDLSAASDVAGRSADASAAERSKDEVVVGKQDDETQIAAAAESAASTSSTAFVQYVDAIVAHLRQLMDAEVNCAVEGEQPKTAQAEKAKAKEEIVDVWEEEGGLGIDF